MQLRNASYLGDLELDATHEVTNRGLCKLMYRLLDTNTVNILIQRGSIGLKRWTERHFLQLGDSPRR